jgi:hypothetical protein
MIYCRASHPARLNKSMEPTGASRSGQLQFVRLGRLAPAAHAQRSADELCAR